MLLGAAQNGDEAEVKLLLKKNADVECKDNEQECRHRVYGHTGPDTALALYGYEEVVKLLLDKNADIESTDKRGRTPLSLTAEDSNEAVVKLLLDKNADIEHKDIYN
ncbi:Ankyrin repeat-containing domain protein [Elaphomyces granulatus]